MCEINPAHSAFFRLEAFTSHRDMTQEQFTHEVMTRLLEAEIKLNEDGRFRFHIHGEESKQSNRALPEQDTCFHCTFGDRRSTQLYLTMSNSDPGDQSVVRLHRKCAGFWMECNPNRLLMELETTT